MLKIPGLTTFPIRVHGGRTIDILSPDFTGIDMDFFAYTLARINRGTGNLPGFYSVAWHSVLLARRCWTRYGDADITRAALLHDAAEAFTGDTPLKPLLPDFCKLEESILRPIFQHFGVNFDLLRHVKPVEDLLLDEERKLFELDEVPHDGLFLTEFSQRSVSSDEVEYLQYAEHLGMCHYMENASGLSR